MLDLVLMAHYAERAILYAGYAGETKGTIVGLFLRRALTGEQLSRTGAPETRENPTAVHPMSCMKSRNRGNSL
jgi:hypothetical protein